jgi:HSP20 family molecular chaperone IbpA
VSFASRPSGAEVSLSDSGDLLGTTPFTQSFAPSSSPLKVKIKLPGYRTKTAEVEVTEGAELSVVLLKAKSRKKKDETDKGKPREDVKRSGTVNPFD